MFEAMLTAASGVRGQQQRLDVIADNLANVNTASFKASRLNFKDALYVAGRYPYGDTAENQQKGHGVLTTSISRIFAGGVLTSTERTYDYGLEGDGFFEIQLEDGSVAYSRAGNFYLSPVNGQQYLVNGKGHFVLDANGSPIVMPAEAQALNLESDGRIIFNYRDGSREEAGFIAIRSFTNNDGLSSLGGSYYAPTANSGEPQQAENFTLRQGVLENSNVDLAQEMTRMIRTQRAFSFSSRALTTADEMEGIANNMKR